MLIEPEGSPRHDHASEYRPGLSMSRRRSQARSMLCVLSQVGVASRTTPICSKSTRSPVRRSRFTVGSMTHRLMRGAAQRGLTDDAPGKPLIHSGFYLTFVATGSDT